MSLSELDVTTLLTLANQGNQTGLQIEEHRQIAH